LFLNIVQLEAVIVQQTDKGRTLSDMVNGLPIQPTRKENGTSELMDKQATSLSTVLENDYSSGTAPAVLNTTATSVPKLI